MRKNKTIDRTIAFVGIACSLWFCVWIYGKLIEIRKFAVEYRASEQRCEKLYFACEKGDLKLTLRSRPELEY